MAARVASFAYNINGLPDEVLCAIISLLPIKEAVRTSVLSRRWRYLFTLMTNLEFDDIKYYPRMENLDGFLDFVDRLVFLQDIRSILRFSFRSFQCVDQQRVIGWICALLGNNIQELEIWAPCRVSLPLSLPQSLFSCESLVIFKLDFCIYTYDFKVPAKICLPRLKILHLEKIVFPYDGSEERLFSSCPVLEDLVLSECFLGRRCPKFNVSNTNLKRLTLDFLTRGECTVPISININTPSLVSLNYSISSDHSLVLIDVKSLVETIITYYWRHAGISAPTLLSWMQNIRTLKISYLFFKNVWCFRVPIPLLDKLTCLKICDWEQMYDPISLTNIFVRCVVLETLIFEESASLPIIKNIRIQHTQWKPTSLCLLSHLKTIEIFSYDVAGVRVLMPFIDFFLKNAKILEVLKIHYKRGHPEQQAEIMDLLSSFPRASEKCRIMYI